jgi:hypothetical protein
MEPNTQFWISIIVAIIGVVVGFLQASILMILRDMKQDAKNNWMRINNHYHEVSCEGAGCVKLKTGNVIIPRGA